MSAESTPPSGKNNQSRTLLTAVLDWIEWAGNKLPDPALLFFIALVVTWIVSALLAPVQFPDEDPRVKAKEAKRVAESLPKTGASTLGLMTTPLGGGSFNAALSISAASAPRKVETIKVKNQLESKAMATFLEKMVDTFTGFHPLGVVLVAMLGVGVAEHTGFINACLKAMLGVTPNQLLTPMLLVVAIVSHTAGDTGYVLVIPLGGVIFAAAGRHPVAGIVAAFAGVSGGFSANFVVSALDPLLQGISQEAAQIRDPAYTINPLCNYLFMASSSLLIVAVGWYLTDYVIEPKLKNTSIDGDPEDMPTMEELTPTDKRGMIAGLSALVLCFGGIAAWAQLDAEFNAIVIKAIVPLIFLFFLIPGVVHGYVAGTVKSHRDIIKGMSKSMSTMGYYLVMAFFAAQFIYAFGESNLGLLLAVKGATFLKEMGLAPQITIIGIIILSSCVNLLVGSASAKWALIGPIFIPMLMELGLSPELTQAGYRVGDSSTNIITPLMPYFPLIVVYAQRYVKSTGIGTLIALMLPYSVCFLITWTLWLVLFWQLGLPLGFPTDVGYTYTPSY